MNERIKKLAEKCVNNTPGCYGFPIIQFDENKFAKLIVYDFLDEIANDGDLGPARINSIKRLAEKWGVSR